MVFDRHALRCTRPSRHAAGSLQASCQAHNMASENTTSPAKLGHATCTCTAGRIPHKRRPRGGDGRRPGCERGAWNSRARLRSDTAVPRSSQSVAFTSATALPGRAASQSPLHRLSFITTVRTSSGPRRQKGTAPGPQVPGRLRTWAHGGRGREEGRGREGVSEGGREEWREGGREGGRKKGDASLSLANFNRINHLRSIRIIGHLYIICFWVLFRFSFR